MNHQKENLILLAIETTCDETGAALIKGPNFDPGTSGNQFPVPKCLSNVVSSQIDLHGPFGGVVPEIASRQHLRSILPVIRQALDAAELDFPDIDAVAVATKPGLVGA
ncbi:MAG: hypothetical protein ACKO0V_09525, partial [bacterium]